MEVGTVASAKFVDGAVPVAALGELIEAYRQSGQTGAHTFFLGQVRRDRIDGRWVTAIEYSAYREMAENVLAELAESAVRNFELDGVHILHSLGRVPTGRLCLLVFVASGHRDAAYRASRHVVEEIKQRVPIFGKEILEDQSHSWKVNR